MTSEVIDQPPERRRALVAQAFAADATYFDPMMSGAGAGRLA